MGIQMYDLRSSKGFYRTEIDGLRALAVSCVVIFHFFPKLLTSGYLGVDVFFVISGFLITSQLINSEHTSIKETLASFYKKRIKRLFPALFLFLTLTYFFVNLLFLSVDVNKFENSLISAYTFWSNIFFWRDGGYFGGNDQLKPLLHIWSLSVEEQFYLISPLTVLLLLKLDEKLNKSLLIGIFAIVILSFILWTYLNSIGSQNPAFFLLPTRVWQFGLGALLAVAYSDRVYKTTSRLHRHLFFTMGLILISLGIFTNIDPYIQTILVTFGTVIFIAYSYDNNSLLAIFFRTKIAVFFGKISYSLYLYHWPIAVGLTYYFIDTIPPSYSILGICISVLLGWISYSFVENKFRYNLSFMNTLTFLLLCVTLSGVIFLTKFKSDGDLLAQTIGNASGTNYRCDVSSYRPYGSSRACILRETSTSNETVVLLGNSHAQMYAPLVAKVVSKNTNLLLVPLNGCIPTTSINISAKCLRMAKKNLSSVLNDKSVSSVIIATTWYRDKYINANGLEVSRESLKTGMDDLIYKIKISGKRPVLFSPIPIPKKNYASELARKLWFNNISEGEVLEIIKVPRSTFETEFSELNDHFIQLLDKSYIRIYDEICDQTYCYYGSDERFYFADSNHLSKNAVVEFTKSKVQLRSLFNANY